MIRSGKRGVISSSSPSAAAAGSVGTMHAEGVGHRLEVCDTDSLIKESKDSTADWSG